MKTVRTEYKTALLGETTSEGEKGKYHLVPFLYTGGDDTKGQMQNILCDATKPITVLDQKKHPLQVVLTEDGCIKCREELQKLVLQGKVKLTDESALDRFMSKITSGIGQLGARVNTAISDVLKVENKTCEMSKTYTTEELVKVILNADEKFEETVCLSEQRLSVGPGDRLSLAVLKLFEERGLSAREAKQTLFQMLIGQDNAHGVEAFTLIHADGPMWSDPLYMRRLLATAVWWFFELAASADEAAPPSKEGAFSIKSLAQYLLDHPDFEAIVTLRPRNVAIQDLRSPGLALSLSIQRAIRRPGKETIAVDAMVETAVAILRSEDDPLCGVSKDAVQDFQERYKVDRLGLIRNVAFHGLWWIVQIGAETYGRRQTH